MRWAATENGLEHCRVPEGQIRPRVWATSLRAARSGGAREAGRRVIGGHTIIDPELKYGMAVDRRGASGPGDSQRWCSARNVLVLTKPLERASSRRLSKGESLEESVRASVQSHDRPQPTASAVMRTVPGLTPVRDVTGFGLLGHAREMADGSGVPIVLEAAKMPLLRAPGVSRNKAV